MILAYFSSRSAISVAKKQSLLALPAPLFRVPYTLRGSFGISTTVESALQIRPFCTNKANFRKSQMNVNEVLTKNYEQIDTWSSGKNKANTKPIQTQFKANTNPNKAKQSQFQDPHYQSGCERGPDRVYIIYNHQLCTLPQQLWPLSRKSISTWKNIYLPICEKCQEKPNCGGFFTSALTRHSEQIFPINV